MEERGGWRSLDLVTSRIAAGLGVSKSDKGKFKWAQDYAEKFFRKMVFGTIKRSRYRPHQGPRECERRAEQLAAGKISNYVHGGQYVKQ